VDPETPPETFNGMYFKNYRRLWLNIAWLVMCFLALLGTVVGEGEQPGTLPVRMGKTVMGLAVLSLVVVVIWTSATVAIRAGNAVSDRPPVRR
jgi:hypothetical protein